MTPATLRTTLAQWRQQAQTQLAAAPAPAVQFEERGRVLSAGDGIAQVAGLASVQLHELVQFEGGQFGQVMQLEPDRVGCVVLDEASSVRAGQSVRRSGEVARVPVGPGLLGRVLDPLGRPLDGGPPVTPLAYLPVERPAPAIIARALVSHPVHTGTLAVDALFPLGRGQRELIIGDRGTGKTTLAVEALLAQRDSELICVYVAVGQRSESTAAVIDTVRRLGAPERTLFVVAAATDSAGLQWLAPMAGMAMAEYFRDRGQHALVVLDDLSKHAATHRELALLMHQPPGREAYPGDVFHLHARLLERAAMLSPAHGGGSLTALPIAQTEAGNLSAYIPTNLISITDGQIVLDSRLFHLGQLPAIDTGLSVSRVGGKTQTRALREAAGSLRLDYAQFLELELFTRFGTSVEPRAQGRITRGQRIRAALLQRHGQPQSAALQLALLLLLRDGALDALPPSALAACRDRLGQWLHNQPEGRALAQALSADPVPATVLADALAQLRLQLPTA